MRELRANTEVIVVIGPFPDVGDGFTPQTDITLGGDEAELLKHGSAAVVDISGATWAAVTDCRGHYALTLTTGYTDTEGNLRVVVQDDSDCLPVKEDFLVLSEAAYDSKYLPKDAGFMDVNVKTIGRADTQETEANNLESACSNYSATRGLTGTAVPAVAASASGGIPVDTDTITLPGQVAPPNTPTRDEALGHLYKNYRNLKDQDNSTFQLYNDAGDTVDQKATLSEAAGTLTKTEIEAGP
jgi:hypothetical protein